MDYNDLANLIFPEVKDIEYYEEKYKKRDLPERAIVTRFAPSPTGFVHIGGLYQALVARTVAKQTNGVFFLRVEDTDQKREVENGITGIVNSLNNFEMSPDEGQINETEEIGEYGPYKQSLRKEIYQAYAKYLVKQGKAYPCFCTSEDLETMRAKQEAAKIRTGYYG
ncbi:MAG: glutamate--tRNA ligase, partial [Clostridia bacterium]|nr:glutamate--tRNA ligase [Clostridia bacterium]